VRDVSSVSFVTQAAGPGSDRGGASWLSTWLPEQPAKPQPHRLQGGVSPCQLGRRRKKRVRRELPPEKGPPYRSGWLIFSAPHITPAHGTPTRRTARAGKDWLEALRMQLAAAAPSQAHRRGQPTPGPPSKRGPMSLHKLIIQLHPKSHSSSSQPQLQPNLIQGLPNPSAAHLSKNGRPSWSIDSTSHTPHSSSFRVGPLLPLLPTPLLLLLLLGLSPVPMGGSEIGYVVGCCPSSLPSACCP
jgi:hypothetical protein